MRYYIVALILQSISFSTARLMSYQTSHIPEEQKAFNCNGRIYDSVYLDQHRASDGRFYNSEALDYGILNRLDKIAKSQGTRQKLMYFGDSSTPCNDFFLTYYDYTPLEYIEDYLVFDTNSRICAMLSTSSRAPHPPTDIYENGISRVKQETFCDFYQTNAYY
ncbi:BgTH12-04107 [Blumeria graminis f. sp. triticale]|uniref:BgtE-5967 n=2 Tax=Blumeria graminis TaxID=34373 RepID=A0A9X9PRM0_BLUGR|nr:BgTH12-04107 [Blumeria graminis f. sp. triticale]VCU40178.1 BgtE-5967 [Blumeria graminis f. sp. tritici]